MVLAIKILNPQLTQSHLRVHQLGILRLHKLMEPQTSIRPPTETMPQMVLALLTAPAVPVGIRTKAEIETPAITQIAVVMLVVIQQIILIAIIILRLITQTTQLIHPRERQAAQTT